MITVWSPRSPSLRRVCHSYQVSRAAPQYHSVRSPSWPLFLFQLTIPLIISSLGFTTTVRPPRAIENNGGFLSGRNLIRNHEEKEEIDNSNDDVEEEEEVDRLHGSFPKFGIDGRRPKVKANIRAKLANKGKKAFFQKFDKPTKKSGRKVNLDHHRKNRIEFVEPIVQEETDFQFSGKA